VGKRWVGIKGGATGIVPVPLAIVRARPLPSASQPIESSRVGDSFDAQHERSSRFTRLSCVAVDVVRTYGSSQRQAYAVRTRACDEGTNTRLHLVTLKRAEVLRSTTQARCLQRQALRNTYYRLPVHASWQVLCCHLSAAMRVSSGARRTSENGKHTKQSAYRRAAD
jgi:hypothetical protein